MRLLSTDFVDNGPLPVQSLSAVLGGEDLSPVLFWEELPADTKSIAVTCYDPDAPTGSGFWHWIVINIPPSASGLISCRTLPAGASAVANDADVAGFVGAYPPPGHGVHRYIYRAHALSVDHIDPVKLPQASVRFQIMMATIASASITGLFSNPA